MPPRQSLTYCRHGRCLTGVAHSVDESPPLLPIDAQPNHASMHARRLGATHCATPSALAPRPQIAGCARAFLRVLLAPLRLLGMALALVGTPAIRVKPGEVKRGQPLWQRQADGVLPSAQHLRQPLPRVGRQGVPPPPRW